MVDVINALNPLFVLFQIEEVLFEADQLFCLICTFILVDLIFVDTQSIGYLYFI